MHTCHVEVVALGDIFNFSKAMADLVQKSLLLFLEIENCVAKTAFFTAVHSYTLPYIMHFMHLCYAKEA